VDVDNDAREGVLLWFQCRNRNFYACAGLKSWRFRCAVQEIIVKGNQNSTNNENSIRRNLPQTWRHQQLSTDNSDMLGNETPPIVEVSTDRMRFACLAISQIANLQWYGK